MNKEPLPEISNIKFECESSLIIRLHKLQLKLQIQGDQINKRQRRAYLLSALRLLQEGFSPYNKALIMHKESFDNVRYKEYIRDVSINQAPDLRGKTLQFGLLLRYNRLGMGLTLTQLADICGVNPFVISKVERGTTNPRVSTVEKIEKGLDLAKLMVKDGKLKGKLRNKGAYYIIGRDLE